MYTSKFFLFFFYLFPTTSVYITKIIKNNNKNIHHSLVASIFSIWCNPTIFSSWYFTFSSICWSYRPKPFGLATSHVVLYSRQYRNYNCKLFEAFRHAIFICILRSIYFSLLLLYSFLHSQLSFAFSSFNLLFLYFKSFMIACYSSNLSFCSWFYSLKYPNSWEKLVAFFLLSCLSWWVWNNN